MYKKENHRAPGSGSISQNPSGTWRAQVKIPSSTADDKFLRKTRSFKTKRDADVWLRNMLAEVEAGLSAENINYTVNQYFSRWLNLKKDGVKDSTFDDYSRNGRIYILPYFGDKFMRNIRMFDVNTFYIVLNDRKIGSRTIGYVHSTLRAMFTEAAREGVVGSNPCTYAKQPQGKSTRSVKILTKSELDHFLEMTKDSRLNVLFLAAVTTGMRLGELLGLRWRDINFSDGLIHVNGQIRSRHIKGKTRQIIETKSEAGNRVLPVGEKMIEDLKRHYDAQKKHKALMAASWTENDLVFPSSVGTPLQPGYAQKGVKAIFAEIGLSNDFTFHALRHTAASFMIHHGMSLIEVSRYLGHSSPVITMKYYGHLVAGGLERARQIQDIGIMGLKEKVVMAESEIFSAQA
jgi:integrase